MWQAPEIYSKMSPFQFADKINEPILLIHGEADNNSGTFPMQSDRLFQAVRGHGGTVRYVSLPHAVRLRGEGVGRAPRCTRWSAGSTGT
ncbi:MAG: prolyl oligopeptidase family serine peptidase [Gemmataceae bacterium]